MMKRRVFLALAAATAGGGFFACRRFLRALDQARSGIGQPAGSVATRHGRMEWGQRGAGPPLLMLHGTGGGFDQGLLFTERLSGAGWRVIAPSRFGYLGTAMPAAPSAAKEADALADLLDHLGIDRLPVIGGSAGALPAIELAIRHPDRVSALVAIVPAAFAPGRPPVRPSALGAVLMRHALGSDALFWAGMTFAEGLMFRHLLATDPGLVRAAAPAEQVRARAILRAILPISLRTRGLLYDGAAAAEPAEQALERIAAPTLAISLEDDRFQTLAAARHLAAGVAGARLVSYPTGGHIWVGRDRQMMAEIDGFLRGQ